MIITSRGGFLKFIFLIIFCFKIFNIFIFFFDFYIPGHLGDPKNPPKNPNPLCLLKPINYGVRCRDRFQPFLYFEGGKDAKISFPPSLPAGRGGGLITPPLFHEDKFYSFMFRLLRGPVPTVCCQAVPAQGVRAASH